jgi:putative ABC transport system substrate-binding protein
MMKRRTFVALGGTALAVPRFLLAQPAKRVFRIAMLDDAVEFVRDQSWRIFRNRLRELVLAEGSDVAYEVRYARGDSEHLPALAAELEELKPDAIVCAGSTATLAAKRATSSIPIVFIGSGDPVASGLVASLARPGANVTGTSNFSPEAGAKQVELLHEISPGAKRLAYFNDASNRGTTAAYRAVERRARDLKLTIRLLDGRKRPVLDRAFETLKRERVQGLIIGASALMLEHRDRFLQFAAQEKLPVVYGRPEYVEAGGLLSYSADIPWLYRRSAEFVHRILMGAKPADLPVEQSRSLRMLLNMKTARVLGIKIPESIRTRVDEVIE